MSHQWLTGHGRATPLLWKTVRSSTLKGNQKRYEEELLYVLRAAVPEGVKVTVVADRGFADGKLLRKALSRGCWPFESCDSNAG